MASSSQGKQDAMDESTKGQADVARTVSRELLSPRNKKKRKEMALELDSIVRSVSSRKVGIESTVSSAHTPSSIKDHTFEGEGSLLRKSPLPILSVREGMVVPQSLDDALEVIAELEEMLEAREEEMLRAANLGLSLQDQVAGLEKELELSLEIQEELEKRAKAAEYKLSLANKEKKHLETELAYLSNVEKEAEGLHGNLQELSSKVKEMELRTGEEEDMQWATAHIMKLKHDTEQRETMLQEREKEMERQHDEAKQAVRRARSQSVMVQQEKEALAANVVELECRLEEAVQLAQKLAEHSLTVQDEEEARGRGLVEEWLVASLDDLGREAALHRALVKCKELCGEYEEETEKSLRKCMELEDELYTERSAHKTDQDELEAANLRLQQMEEELRVVSKDKIEALAEQNAKLAESSKAAALVREELQRQVADLTTELESERASKKEALRLKSNELLRCQAELKDLQKAAAEDRERLHADARRAEERALHDFQKREAKLKQQVATHQKCIADLEDQLRSAEGELAKLRLQLSTAESAVRTVEGKQDMRLRRAEERLKEVEEDRAGWQTKAENYAMQLQEREKALSDAGLKLAQEVEAVTKKLSDAHAEAAKYKKRILELELEADGVKARQEHSEEALEEMKQRFEDVLDCLNKAEASNELLVAKHKEMQQASQRQRQECLSYRQQLGQAIEEEERLRGEVETLRDEAARAREEGVSEGTRSAEDAAAAAKRAMEVLRKAHQDEVDGLRHVLKTAQDQAETAEQDVSRLTAAVESERARADSLHEDCEALRSEVRELRGAAAAAEREAHEYANTITRLMASVEAAEGRASTAETSLAQLKDERKKLREESELKADTIAAKEVVVATLKHLFEEEKKKVAQAIDDRNASTQALAASRETEESLLQQIERLQRVNQSLSDELNEAVSHIEQASSTARRREGDMEVAFQVATASERKLTDLHQENAVLRHEVSQLSHALAESRETVGRLRQDTEEARRAAQKGDEEHESRYSLLADELDAAKTREREAADKAAALQEALDEALGRLAESSQTAEKARADALTVEERLANISKEAEDRRAKCAELEEQLRAAKDDLLQTKESAALAEGRHHAQLRKLTPRSSSLFEADANIEQAGMVVRKIQEEDQKRREGFRSPSVVSSVRLPSDSGGSLFRRVAASTPIAYKSDTIESIRVSPPRYDHRM